MQVRETNCGLPVLVGMGSLFFWDRVAQSQEQKKGMMKMAKKWTACERWGQRNWNVKGFNTPMGEVKGRVYEVVGDGGGRSYVANVEMDGGNILQQKRNFSTLEKAQSWCVDAIGWKLHELKTAARSL